MKVKVDNSRVDDGSSLLFLFSIFNQAYPLFHPSQSHVFIIFTVGASNVSPLMPNYCKLKAQSAGMYSH